jgi:hypothetical protein
MTRRIKAEYLADEQKLRLEGPLEGVEDHQKVIVAVDVSAEEPGDERPWIRFRGILSQEAGREVALAIREAFGRDEIEI